jgi:hypothetical protein
MIGRVKVNRMPDVGSDDFKVSARMATRAFIDRIGAEVIRSVEAQIDKEHMNVDGMTGFFFYKEQPQANQQPLSPQYRPGSCDSTVKRNGPDR